MRFIVFEEEAFCYLDALLRNRLVAFHCSEATACQSWHSLLHSPCYVLTSQGEFLATLPPTSSSLSSPPVPPTSASNYETSGGSHARRWGDPGDWQPRHPLLPHPTYDRDFQTSLRPWVPDSTSCEEFDELAPNAKLYPFRRA